MVFQRFTKGSKAEYLNPKRLLDVEGYITREEVISILGHTFDIDLEDSSTKKMSDVGDMSLTNQKMLNALLNKGYISGYPDGTFKPKNQITRAELVKIIHNISSNILIDEKEYTSKDLTGNVIVKSDNIKLDNLSVKGNIYVSGNVKNLKIKKSNVAGDIIVLSNGLDNMIVDKSNIDKVNIENNSEKDVNLDIINDSKIGSLNMIGKLRMNADLSSYIAVISNMNDIFINNIQIPKNSKTTLMGGKPEAYKGDTTSKKKDNKPVKVNENNNSQSSGGGYDDYYSNDTNSNNSTNNILVNKIEIKDVENPVKEYKKVELLSSVYPNNANNRNIIWEVEKSDDAKAEIIDNKILLPKVSGDITLVASATDGSGVRASKKIRIEKEVIYKDTKLNEYLEYKDSELKLIISEMPQIIFGEDAPYPYIETKISLVGDYCDIENLKLEFVLNNKLYEGLINNSEGADLDYPELKIINALKFDSKKDLNGGYKVSLDANLNLAAVSIDEQGSSLNKGERIEWFVLNNYDESGGKATISRHGKLIGIKPGKVKVIVRYEGKPDTEFSEIIEIQDMALSEDDIIVEEISKEINDNCLKISVKINNNIGRIIEMPRIKLNMDPQININEESSISMTVNDEEKKYLDSGSNAEVIIKINLDKVSIGDVKNIDLIFELGKIEIKFDEEDINKDVNEVEDNETINFFKINESNTEFEDTIINEENDDFKNDNLELLD